MKSFSEGKKEGPAVWTDNGIHGVSEDQDKLHQLQLTTVSGTNVSKTRVLDTFDVERVCDQR